MKTIFIYGLTFTLCFGPLFAEEFEIGLSIREVGQRKKVSLAPCPSSPNCVTSIQHSNPQDPQLMEPLKGRAKGVSYSKIKLILKQDGAEIQQEKDDYIHATYTSTFFKFVDDVEFFFPNEETIHFRSASRTGYSDLGVNKRRITRLKLKFQEMRD